MTSIRTSGNAPTDYPKQVSVCPPSRDKISDVLQNGSGHFKPRARSEQPKTSEPLGSVKLARSG